MDLFEVFTGGDVWLTRGTLRPKDLDEYRALVSFQQENNHLRAYISGYAERVLEDAGIQEPVTWEPGTEPTRKGNLSAANTGAFRPIEEDRELLTWRRYSNMPVMESYSLFYWLDCFPPYGDSDHLERSSARIREPRIRTRDRRTKREAAQMLQRESEKTGVQFLRRKKNGSYFKTAFAVEFVSKFRWTFGCPSSPWAIPTIWDRASDVALDLSEREFEDRIIDLRSPIRQAQRS